MKDTVNMKIHSTGHGNQEDIRAMVEFIRPKYNANTRFLTFRYFNKQNLEKWELIQTIFSLLMMGKFGSIQTGNGREGKYRIKPILIDGLGVGDIGDMVLKDRKQLAEYGIFSVILNLSANTHKILESQFFQEDLSTLNSQSLLKEITNTILMNIGRGLVTSRMDKPDYDKFKEI